ncbi:MAG: hypothetical protein GQ526_04370, partial [Ardenticatenales bacterium]|nr:hypothetical protein [Ardenticatenales bacterium]
MSKGVVEQVLGMPGRPAPVRPIPQHEVGKPSRAANYLTEVTRLNKEGVE